MDISLWGRIIGRREFPDGIERDVYEDVDGQQYVHGDDGGKVYGDWLPPADDSDLLGQDASD
jgi:hypothetical protein